MVDFSSGFGGAASGAYAGSAFGPVGAAAGGLLGGIGGLFSKKKKKKNLKRLSSFDPQQQELYNQRMASIRGEGPFSDAYKYDAEAANRNFDMNTARPALRSFREDIIPQITGQYRRDNLMNSSYSGEALGRAGRDVQENLDALRSDMNYRGGQAAIDRRERAIDSSLGNTTFDYKKPQYSENLIDQIISQVGSHGADYLSDYIRKRNAVPYQQNQMMNPRI